jgi:hypothetical protein
MKEAEFKKALMRYQKIKNIMEVISPCLTFVKKTLRLVNKNTSQIVLRKPKLIQRTR